MVWHILEVSSQYSGKREKVKRKREKGKSAEVRFADILI